MQASAAIAWDNGLNRERFRRGEISAYDWQDVGSSFMPSEITAALLLTQLNRGHAITQRRLGLWNQYYVAFQAMEEAGVVRRPHIPDGTSMNGHIFYLVYADVFERDRAIRQAEERGVMLTSHYVPLHLSRAGQKFGRLGSDLHITEKSAETIVRLPMLVDMTTEEFERVVKAVALEV
jgi:dTDP-4-amino-4,6-dideoxygalactose transaminase